MKLTEAEMRMVFQIESTNQNAALNEIYMTWRYAPNPATKETAEGLYRGRYCHHFGAPPPLIFPVPQKP